MRIYDIIEKKKRGIELNKPEIDYIVNGYLIGDIPDYQMSAFLMAIYFQGMTDEELSNLTFAMRDSGDIIDLSPIKGVVVDKHSTGGVGDKTTLIVAAIAASFGVKVCKMSGRGLGHTGGTVDKMDSIPGMRTDIPNEEVFEIVNDIGLCVIGQTGNLAPADKKIYALRDVTATVDSIPLIAASIMSKKLAAGSDAIVLDVKMGSGAFMKSQEDARNLAEMMVKIGNSAGKKTVALITDMDIPLGRAIGNRIEIKEIIETLKGSGPKDLEELSIELASQMIKLSGLYESEDIRSMARESLQNGKAYEKFIEMLKAQGADIDFVKKLDEFTKADFSKKVISDKSGMITEMDTEKIGIAASVLGAGRLKIGDDIDYMAGIKIIFKKGDIINKGDILAEIYSSDSTKLKEAEEIISKSYKFDTELKEYPLIIDIIN
ncbi:MAG: thymidine phosphorylase [Tissierellia bacterium]|nr:thymidine phosphorylase [Tissierellia bacterium]